MNRNSNTPAEQTTSDYFDLHATGCGYLSRVRWVNPKRGESFLACKVNALHGRCDEPSYSSFDLRVSGAEAESLVLEYAEDVEKDRKVFIAFRVGDIYADPYMADERVPDKHDPKKWVATGQQVPRATIKGRLLLITHVQVDNEVVYQRPNDRDDDAGPSASASGDDVGSAQSDDSRPDLRQRQATRQATAPEAQRGQRASATSRGRSMVHA